MNEKKIYLIPHHCMLQIQALYDSMKKAEKKATDFILDNPESICSMNIVDFAEKAGCSEATIVRLSKKLGYDGFPELKRDFEIYLKSDSKDNTSTEYENITSTDSPITIVQKVFESSLTALEDTLKVLDDNKFTNAAKMVCNAKKIMFVGVGDASAVALEAYQRYVRIRKNCFFSMDFDVQLILASQLEKDDVLIAISHSGRTKTVLECARTAQDNGANVISITNYPMSPLAKTSTIILQTAVFIKNICGEVMAKRITALCLIESLYIYTLFCKGDTYINNLLISNDIVKYNKL